jgi:hypothetical protein
MTINYTTLLGLALPVTGTESGTWGDDVNLGITNYSDIAIAGTNNITNDSDITLSITNGSSAGSNIVASPNSTTAQYMQLLCTGTRTAIRNINAPNSSKMYVVSNTTSGGFAIVIRGVTGPTTGVTVANGEKCIVFWSSVASDFIKITSNIITNLTGTLLTSNGGTGLSSYTAGDLSYYASGTALTKLAIGIAGQILTVNSGATAPQWSTLSSVAVTSITFGSTGLTPSTATTGVISVGGTLAIGSGGTGATTAANALVNLGVQTSSTGSEILPSGTTAQRDSSPVLGYIRFNSTTGQFEGYSQVSGISGWYSVGGSSITNDTATATAVYPLFANATSGTAQIIYTSNAKYLYTPSTGLLQAPNVSSTNGIHINGTTVSTSITIATGTNGFSVGPITTNSGVTVTVASGQRWVTI